MPNHYEECVEVRGLDAVAGSTISATIYAIGTDSRGLYIGGPVVQLVMMRAGAKVVMQFTPDQFRETMLALAMVADKQPAPQKAPPIHEER